MVVTTIHIVSDIFGSLSCRELLSRGFHSLSSSPSDRRSLWRCDDDRPALHWSVMSYGNTLAHWIITPQYRDTCHVSQSPGHCDKSQPCIILLLSPSLPPSSSIWSQLRPVYFYFIWFTIQHSCWHNGHSGILNQEGNEKENKFKLSERDFRPLITSLGWS